MFMFFLVSAVLDLIGSLVLVFLDRLAGAVPH